MEELDQFFSVTLDLLCIANTDGYFLRLNPSWERILGHPREELIAKQPKGRKGGADEDFQ